MSKRIDRKKEWLSKQDSTKREGEAGGGGEGGGEHTMS